MVIIPVPGLARSAAVTTTVMDVGEMNDVDSEVPPKKPIAAAVNPVPVSVTVVFPEPCMIEEGDMELSVASGSVAGLIVNVRLFELPALFWAVIAPVPPLVKSAAGITAVMEFGERNVVARAVASKKTTVKSVKLTPVIVTMRSPAPACADDGVILDRIGAC